MNAIEALVIERVRVFGGHEFAVDLVEEAGGEEFFIDGAFEIGLGLFEDF